MIPKFQNLGSKEVRLLYQLGAANLSDLIYIVQKQSSWFLCTRGYFGALGIVRWCCEWLFSNETKDVRVPRFFKAFGGGIA